MLSGARWVVHEELAVTDSRLKRFTKLSGPFSRNRAAVFKQSQCEVILINSNMCHRVPVAGEQTDHTVRSQIPKCFEYSSYISNLQVLSVRRIAVQPCGVKPILDRPRLVIGLQCFH